MVTYIINKYKAKLNGNPHLKEIFSGSANVLAIKVLGMILALIVTLFSSKKYGAEGIGFYNLSIRTITFLALASTLGINTAILRYVGQFNKKGSEYKLKLLFKHSIQIVLPISIFVGILLFATSDWIANDLFHNIKYKNSLSFFSITIPFLALLNISVQYIRGLKFIKVSESLRSVTGPVVNIILLIIIGIFVHTYLLPIFTFSMAIIITTILSVIFIYKKIHNIPYQSQNTFTKNELIKTSIPMLTITVASFLQGNIPIYFLEAYTSTDQVGIFSVSLRLAALISLVLIAINTISAPKFSELYWSDNYKELQNVIYHSSKLLFILSVIPAVIIILCAKQILQIFGSAFIEGNTVLIILICGQLINSITGSVGALINMTGHQKALRNIILFTLIINIPLSYTFIPIYGVKGAAFVTMLTGSISNISAVVYAKRKIGFTTYYLPFLGYFSNR